MSMERLRQAVGNTIREADGVVHQSKHRGDQAVIYDAAKSVLDAPRIWWCETHRSVIPGGADTHPSDPCWFIQFCAMTEKAYPNWAEHPKHLPCRMVEASVVVGDPQEGGEE